MIHESHCMKDLHHVQIGANMTIMMHKNAQKMHCNTQKYSPVDLLYCDLHLRKKKTQEAFPCFCFNKVTSEGLNLQERQVFAPKPEPLHTWQNHINSHTVSI